MNDDATQAQLEHAQEVQEKYTDELMSKAHVVGVAIGFTTKKKAAADDDSNAKDTDNDRQICLVVMVDEIVPNDELPPKDRIPEEIEGVPVQVQQTGLFTAGFAAG